MNNNIKRGRLLPVILTVLILIFITVLSGQTELEHGLYVFDVGQGDSALLLSGETAVLIDAGTGSYEERLVAYIEEIGIAKLDALILTHPHEDHIGGADKVIKSFEVSEIIMPDATTETSAFNKLLDAAEQRNVPISTVVRGDSFAIGGIKLNILSPRERGYDDLNNSSIVFTAELDGARLMFTGDAEAKVEYEILDEFNSSELDCDFLKVAHHGSSTSNTEDFIKAVSPELASISCGADNDYGHPHRETKELFKKLGLTYYRTDLSGNLVFEIKDGEITKVK